MVRYLFVVFLFCVWPLVAGAAAQAPVSDAGVSLIVRFEVISPGYYRRALTRPVWPGGASGATIGIGYDLGHQAPPVICEDWQDHPQVSRLVVASGVRGSRAKAVASSMADVVTVYPIARDVFATKTLPRYWLATKRAYPGVEGMPQGVIDALVSVTYNRGTSMAGDRGREKRVIRDVCIPAGSAGCVADQIRAMKRLWRGLSIEHGMDRRRNAEADLAGGLA